MGRHRISELVLMAMNVFLPLMLVLSTNTVYSERANASL